MRKKNNLLSKQKEHLQNLLESFSEKDLYVVISFAEFIFKSKSAEKLDLPELIAQIRKAREGVRRGKYSSLDEVKREFGL